MARAAHVATMAVRSGWSSGSPRPCSVTLSTWGASSSRATKLSSGKRAVRRSSAGRYRTRHIRHWRLRAPVTSTCSAGGRERAPRNWPGRERRSRPRWGLFPLSSREIRAASDGYTGRDRGGPRHDRRRHARPALRARALAVAPRGERDRDRQRPRSTGTAAAVRERHPRVHLIELGPTGRGCSRLGGDAASRAGLLSGAAPHPRAWAGAVVCQVTWRRRADRWTRSTGLLLGAWPRGR
jgi:hypothetical protein